MTSSSQLGLDNQMISDAYFKPLETRSILAGNGWTFEKTDSTNQGISIIPMKINTNEIQRFFHSFS